jgi:hypothetical protein
MEIDLAELCAMHPRLPQDLALLLATRAALGFERHGHGTPLSIGLDIERAATRGLLAWPGRDLSDLEQHDYNRVTEDGAEAVALALAHRGRGWRIVRRMQREEYADWLLEQTEGGPRQLVALEVSGVDRGGIGARLAKKLDQVARSSEVDQQWAGVVGFHEPQAALRSTKADLS